MTGNVIRRREFISLLGAAAAVWPRAARAQQQGVPVIGYLGLGTATEPTAEFRRGLSEMGYVEGRNVAIEFRSAQNDASRLPDLAAELVRRRVSVIYAGGGPTARAAAAATTTIPIVFGMGEDPVKEGVVASFNRPGGNVTGFTDFSNQLAGKRLGLLREVVPAATVFGLLVNPSNPNAEPDTKDVQSATDALRRPLRVFAAVTARDFEPAFAGMIEARVGALFVGIDPFFRSNPAPIVALAARHALPTIYERRVFTAAGGLMSYGTDPANTNRQAGIYVGRILKGEKPADLPVQQPTKFEFVINLKTARALGLDIPPGVLAIADEVIE
jgi:putative tryptophan/tyrosine transport system substrate-binding protein